MIGDALAGVLALPEWLLLGLAIGSACSLCLAGVFVVGERLSPTPVRTRRDRPADDRRRAEIRDYLRAVGEPFAEDHAVAGAAVAFYLPDRDVAITFDARAYYRIERTPTQAVLVEHELPGGHLGSRLPFETPDLPPDAAAETGLDPTAAAFAVLSLPPTASAAEVRDAYRRQVKDAHPDHGGSHGEFRRVREAYTTAKRAAS